MRKQKSFPFWFVLLSLLFIVSCRKSDIEIPIAETPTSIERFFNLPESADPRLKAIAQSIRTQEKEHPFLKDFTKRTGWPVWNKVKMIGPGIGNVTSTSGTNSTTLVYIPFVQDSAVTVNAVLAVKLDPFDTAFRILYANNYASFGFGTTADNTWNARNVFQFFALFEYEIFGHTKFLIKDERLFNTPTDSFTVTLKSINDVAINSRTTDEYSMTICTIQTICSPDPVAPPISTDNFVRTTDNCYNTSTCNTYNWGNGGTDWTGSGWSPNNSGGGSGGSWGTTTSCMNTSTGTFIACSPGWVPADGPYVLTEDDIRIWNQIEQEDAQADNLAPLDCQGTGTIGNLNWQGVLEHNIIQLDYLATHPTGRREFQIPNAGTPGSGRPGRADLVDLAYDIIWEIKPPTQQAAGVVEVANYVLHANISCSSPLTPGGPPRVWTQGTGYGPHYFPSKYPDKYLSAYESTSPGVILYEYVLKNTVPVPVPVVLPVTILDKLKELVDKLKDDASKFKEVISEYLREHPELVTFLKAAAVGAAVAIIVGTIVEDFFSGGVGILDDIASFTLAYRIVRFAWAL